MSVCDKHQRYVAPGERCPYCVEEVLEALDEGLEEPLPLAHPNEFHPPGECADCDALFLHYLGRPIAGVSDRGP